MKIEAECSNPKNFAIIGVAGFIAPRHLRAVYETGNRVVAAVDPHDSVGILDSFGQEISFFKEFERFDRHCEKLRRKAAGTAVDYVSICSPNYLHDAHVRFALRIGADAICEKPLVLNPWNLDALEVIANETGRRIYTILQLRLHPSLINLRENLSKQPKNGKREVVLTYITSRGLWYNYSWKGSVERSGGLPTNIGIHFFDLLIWLFGEPNLSELHLDDGKSSAGYLEFEQARVRWFLSIDQDRLPEQARTTGKPTFRSITIDGDEIEFSDGFRDLHTDSYGAILKGEGFGIAEARPSITLVHGLRSNPPVKPDANAHPYI